MNILIICTYYPPDIAISAKRPYMLAKYLGKMGHNVTVIRSGEIDIKIDEEFVYESQNVKVYSYLGPQSTAERFARGEIQGYTISSKNLLGNMPLWLKKIIIKVYSGLIFPIRIYKFYKNAEKRSILINNFIDNLEEKNFDIVFSTYSNLENLYAGEYAAKKFGCKYIADVRDLIAQKSRQPFLEYLIKRRTQKHVIMSADACTAVSNGLAETIQKQAPSKQVVTLYNGYEHDEQARAEAVSDNRLSFCYTGSMYKKLSDASAIFKALSELEKEGKIDRKNVVFNYAGMGYNQMLEQAKKFGFEDVLVNYGFLDKEKTERLQRNSDLFVVLSWNMKNNTGILTGKFYESIKIRRPVIALVSGNKSGSELRSIIKNYNLGLCCETSFENTNIVKDYILTQYECKMRDEALKYDPNPEVFERFEYGNITKQLDNIITDLIK